jgi:choline dehydrogenase-like flavoprotein
MYIDARTLSGVDSIECDICVIGAGAAGITLAREFAGRSEQVCLVESGDFEIDAATQELYQGESVGLPYLDLDSVRLRFFGGTTNHWAGQCLRFSASDFQIQPWLPYSGWPFDLADILPYYDRAATLLGLPEEGWDVTYWADALGYDAIEFDPARFHPEMFLIEPLRMGDAFRQDLEASNIRTYLNANVVELETNESARVVTAARIRTLARNDLRVLARHFVLAAGGIENPRLLLSSDTVQREGLGNRHDLVGRFFLEHPNFVGGTIQPSSPGDPLWFYDRNRHSGAQVRPYLLLSDDLQRDEELVPTGVSLLPVGAASYEARSIRSLRAIARDLLAAEVPDDLWRHVGNIASDLGGITDLAHDWLRYGQIPIEHVDCQVAMTPAPNPDSRVMLGDRRDALGLRQVELDWRLSEIDRRSARRTMELLGQEVGRLGLGRLKMLIDEDTTWPDNLEGAFHHAGTTRMADDPTMGVVDRNCRIHGMSNLFVAGSSVFPTIGAGTPTFLIIALAMRLADHIKASTG